MKYQELPGVTGRVRIRGDPRSLPTPEALAHHLAGNESDHVRSALETLIFLIKPVTEVKVTASRGSKKFQSRLPWKKGRQPALPDGKRRLNLSARHANEPHPTHFPNRPISCNREATEYFPHIAFSSRLRLSRARIKRPLPFLLPIRYEKRAPVTKRLQLGSEQRRRHQLSRVAHLSRCGGHALTDPQHDDAEDRPPKLKKKKKHVASHRLSAPAVTSVQGTLTRKEELGFTNQNRLNGEYANMPPSIIERLSWRSIGIQNVISHAN